MRNSEEDELEFLEDLIDEESSIASDFLEDLSHQFEVGELVEEIDCESS